MRRRTIIMKTLTAYFSASGTTEALARSLAEHTGSELFEIVPKVPYSDADLNYMNPLARCNREMITKKDVSIVSVVRDMDTYDLIFLGFPIWYYGAPLIITSFLKEYDLTGKKIALFATSGGSDIGKTAQKLKPYIGEAEIIGADVFRDSDSLNAWADGLLEERKEF